MKILWFCPYPIDIASEYGLKQTRPSSGHPCSWIVNLADALSKKKNVELHIATLAARIPNSQSIPMKGYTLHVIRDAIPGTDRQVAGLWHLDARTRFHSRVRKLNKIAEKIQPDILHGHGTEDAYSLATIQGRWPAVISIQGVMEAYDKVEPKSRFHWTAKTEAITISKGSHFFCRTDFDSGFVAKKNKKAKITYMPEAIAKIFFKIQKNQHGLRKILYIGGKSPLKGLEDCLKAFSLVADQIPDAHLDIVGVNSAEIYSKFLPNDRVHFHGFCTSEAIASFHQDASAMIMTSKCENSPNAVMEALCAGTPVIAYAVGGVPSLLHHGKRGLLVKYGDTAAMADEIQKLLLDHKKSQQLITYAKKSVQENHPDQVAEQTLQAYNKILENKHD